MSRSRNTLAAVLFIALLLVPVGCSRVAGRWRGRSGGSSRGP